MNFCYFSFGIQNRAMRPHYFTLIALFLFIFSGSASGQKKLLFDYNEGLSNSLINEVYQDHIGFIWVATEDGLNRFDGIKFKAFEGSKNDSTCLKANFVTSLFEDSKGNFWIGQINGLQVYHHNSESFSEIKIFINDKQIHPYVSDITEAPNGDIWITTSAFGLIKIDHTVGRARYSTRLNHNLCSFYLECLFLDSDGVLWIGSDNNGISTYNLNTEEIQTFSKSKSKPFNLPSNDITDICEDHKGNIYIGTLKSGLLQYNKQNQILTSIKPSDPDDNDIPVKSLLFDSKKRLWVGTDGKGLRKLNSTTGLLEKMHPGSSSFDFSKSKIHSITEDNVGNIWLGIFQKGLYLFPESKELFNHYGYRAFGENSIGSNCITALNGDKNNLWIGTDGDGIYHMDWKSHNIKQINLENKKSKSEGNNVLSLYDSDDNYLWIGTFFNGLLKYNKKTGNLKTYKNDPSNPNSLINDKITAIRPVNDKELWLTTLGGGICRFNTENDIFQAGLNWPDSLNQLIPKWVNDIYVDQKQNVWIGTYDGLVYAQTHKNELKLYSTEDNFLPHNVVYCIVPDSNGNLWVGTYGGLVRVNLNTLESHIFSTTDGLSSNVICGILEDNNQQIWISTHNGLSRYNPDNSTFTTYFASDGLQANEFSRNAVFKTDDNKLLFGGINGISEVKKDYLNFKRTIRDVMLTDFKVLNKHVEIGQKTGRHTILNKSIVLADTVKLKEKDNVFSIGFSSVELANQSRISYEYKMEGFDENWNVSNSLNRSATYTNLKHGTYEFLVRGVDKKQYSEPRKLTIIIYPPWYKTNWAKILWIALAFIILYTITLFYKEKLLRLEAEKTNETKMQFFINISHEIKTPLTLIIDPLEKLLQKRNSEENQRLFKTMHLNANRIFRLVCQLLDVRKIDKGQLLFKFQKTNLFDFIKEVAQSYQLAAESKSITFNINCNNENIEVWIDPLNFEKVILNLLSNAFKYTPNGGCIEINLNTIGEGKKTSTPPTHAQIIITDTGNGLKKGDFEKIFDRFYQSQSNDNLNITGTGIGLNLSRSLVELHKGILYAQNRSDKPGAKFIIEIPLGSDHLPQEDLILEKNILPAPSLKLPVIEQVSIESNSVSKTPKSNYKLMVIDDEDEIRNYLIQELSSVYNVVACINGKEAFDQLQTIKPDLIISDIMMPEMDGITLCKKIKGNNDTSHIPVILLTALSKDEDKAQGIETGADMYLVKPFNSSFLKKTIANLLENRRKIYQQLALKGDSFNIENVKLKSHDEILMQKIMTIIKDNISDSNLNVEVLADGVGISRVHMHRKLKELTNQSARDFIKNIRMKQAAYILSTKKLNISEVAYAVGYTSLPHFSNSFKAFYGISPKEYALNNDNLEYTKDAVSIDDIKN